MDANRNIENYLKEKQRKINEFLGSATWRERWKTATQRRTPFPQFLAEEFSASMETLHYRTLPFYKMKPIKNFEKNVQLYRLALFSRSPRAYKFWDEVLKYTSPQTELPFENPDVD